jgi:hypothetical protein
MLPFHLYIPLDGKNLRDESLFHETYYKPPPFVVRSGGSRSSSRHPAGEGNPYRRPSPPPRSPPEWCVSSLPWTTDP